MNDAKKTGGPLGEWISRDDLAESLGVTTVTMGRWASEGTGPAQVKIGRRVFYRKKAVEKWLQEMER